MEIKDRKCKCQLCLDIGHLKERGVSQDFINRYLDEGLDADYNKAILDGSWPQSLEILRHKVAKLENAQ